MAGSGRRLTAAPASGRGLPGERLTFIDTRGHAAWHQGRAVGAIHLPTAEIVERAASEIPQGVPAVVSCWGPGCNGATKAALQLSRLGYEVREMIGGFEYWAREGVGVVDDRGEVVREVDGLTSPRNGIDCDC
ncbi:MAG TPA: rhodanese-like domain-containing protein [Pseudolysinimonas sp.]|nr:rhodanese-like domain-containing protein [Pseudolysinimonas sp.]